MICTQPIFASGRSTFVRRVSKGLLRRRPGNDCSCRPRFNHAKALRVTLTGFTPDIAPPQKQEINQATIDIKSDLDGYSQADSPLQKSVLTGVLKLSPTKTRLRAVPGIANSTIDEIKKGDIEPSCQTASVAKISKAMESSQGVPKNEKATFSYAQYENPPQPASKEYPSRHCHQAYIALGSNVGNRISMIESACRQMECQGIHVVRTSFLYETKAMYLHDQASFINGACEVTTSFSPFELLDKLKEIEAALGRKKLVTNGPRNIDLDILLYDNDIVDHERLSIPHKRLSEREFVLRPLCDLIPTAVFPSPLTNTTFENLLKLLPKSNPQLSPLTPYSPSLDSILSLSPTRVTHVMAVLNLTPDSFSDGGRYATEPSSLSSIVNNFLSVGASILDIGGQSTRPHAPQVSAEEEISRILPAIKLIRSQTTFDQMAISIDTYRASVAKAAILAGANIVNDVSGGTMDVDMLPTIAELGCTVILMHMRGNPETMTTLTEYLSGVVKGVGTELLECVSAAEKAGIRRWRIILDPGIGFAKNESQNLTLLRDFRELRDQHGLRGFPWVIGASRKSFIGRITGVKKASERIWGTASAVAAAVQGGADIVRVHDAAEMVQVAKMADAIWRVDPDMLS